MFVSPSNSTLKIIITRKGHSQVTALFICLFSYVFIYINGFSSRLSFLPPPLSGNPLFFLNKLSFFWVEK